MIFNSTHPESHPSRHRHRKRLSELALGEEAVVETVDLPGPAGRRLMELGFLPGNRVRASAQAPGGDPLVFGVDGTLVALRRETAEFLTVVREASAAD